MSVPPTPDDEWVRLPLDWTERLTWTVLDGQKMALLQGDVLSAGTRIQLHRSGYWHEAEVVYGADGSVRVRVVSTAWPGAPCIIRPGNMGLLLARRKR